MMNKILSVLKIFIIIFFIVFIITITTYSLVMIFGYDSKDSSQWISFIGSIIGGALTLIGVYYTVKVEKNRWKIENKKRDEESLENNKILYKPIFSLKEIKIKSKIDYDIDNKFQIHFVLKIYNVGRGEAYDIDLSYLPKILHITFDDFTDFDLIANGDYITLDCLILAKDKNEVLYIANTMFDFEIKFNSAFDCDLKQNLHFKLDIENLSDINGKITDNIKTDKM